MFSLILLGFTAPISYITSTFIVEVISDANAVKSQGRNDTLFPNAVYASPASYDKFNNRDINFKTSPYYIRNKVEIGKLFEQFCAPWIKVAIMIVLVIYIYGALCLKYASGAASFVSGISSTVYGGDQNQWAKEWSSFDPYYLSIMIFAGLSMAFCFGNIENSKYL